MIKEDEENHDEIIELIEIDTETFGRQNLGKKARWYILYPDDNIKLWWDLLNAL